MATSSIPHYCHTCEERITPILADDCLTCPSCYGGFVEELDIQHSPEPQRSENILNTFNSLMQMDDNLLNSSDNFETYIYEDMEETPSRTGDYVIYDSDTQVSFPEANIMHILMLLGSDLHLPVSGAPPASSESIDQLQKTLLNDGNIAQFDNCSICFENYAVSDFVLHLPCEHIFHDTCIKTWLSQHGTCPICRKDLLGRDTSHLNA